MSTSYGNLLFLCVANSARSQMAEGLARQMVPSAVEVMSAGSSPTVVNPFAVQAMSEIGIDLRLHRSKSIEEIDLSRVGTVITLCADEVCPILPGSVQKLHWPHSDPAAAEGSDAERLAAFRKVRDEIRTKLEAFLRG